ncbi:MAG: hypothetical protein JO314_05020, partial [Acidobacteria bacterium]|nr:hypothetical protein [Acidobacteriota bacterium]
PTVMIGTGTPGANQCLLTLTDKQFNARFDACKGSGDVQAKQKSGLNIVDMDTSNDSAVFP